MFNCNSIAYLPVAFWRLIFRQFDCIFDICHANALNVQIRHNKNCKIERQIYELRKFTCERYLECVCCGAISYSRSFHFLSSVGRSLISGKKTLQLNTCWENIEKGQTKSAGVVKYLLCNTFPVERVRQRSGGKHVHFGQLSARAASKQSCQFDSFVVGFSNNSYSILRRREV